uniref:Uncharacterized protein n=1 Tax=Nelumbo nucifera TaxID=4432 RepID=A0A822ZXQ3_NELNU|nr:TPA_asm: hypothetical protein HUJ06_016625 [Nelumbo nucifera]
MIWNICLVRNSVVLERTTFNHIQVITKSSLSCQSYHFCGKASSHGPVVHHPPSITFCWQMPPLEAIKVNVGATITNAKGLMGIIVCDHSKNFLFDEARWQFLSYPYHV